MEARFSCHVLLLDVGGVLLTNGWDHESRALAAKTFNLDLKDLNQRHDLVFPIYEIGKITLSQYLDYTVFHTSRSFSQEEFQSFICNQSQSLPDVLNYLKQLKGQNQVRIGLLSNEGKELADYRVKNFKLNEAADFLIFSGYVGLRKPDPDIYRLALNLASSLPQEALYLDDRRGMVEFGASLGLQAHQHIDFSSTKKIIELFLSHEG